MYTIYIHNVPWKIEFVEKDAEVISGSCGITYKEECISYIRNDLSDEMTRRTLIHEIAHAYIWVYGFEDITNRKFTEEDLCNFIETYGYDIISQADTVLSFYDKKSKRKDGGN